ncbi:hypothetical protein TKK_0013402 [Trichogramma kaykai]|uniref:Tesmin/TSO1-like CXC domain-containing protein n=2 Tax=Trichogramma kaykai TaxID=54128 RepID=A0ABD2WIV9_9HYME
MENFHNDTKQLKSSSSIEFFKQLREYQEQLECVEKLSLKTRSSNATNHAFEQIINLSTSTIGEPNSQSFESIRSSSTANFLENLSEKSLSNKGDGSMTHENISSHKEIPVQIQLEVVNHQKECALNFSKKDSIQSHPTVDLIHQRSMNESIFDPSLTASKDTISNLSTILKEKRTDPSIVSGDLRSDFSTITENRPDLQTKSKPALIFTESEFDGKQSNSLHPNVMIEHKVIPNDTKASGSFSIKIINQVPIQPSDNNEPSITKIGNENLKEKKIQPKEQILDSLEKILMRTTEKLNDLDKMKLLMENIENELINKKSKKNVNVSISHSKRTLKCDSLKDGVATDINYMRKDVKTKKNYVTQKLSKQSSKFSICSNGTVSSDEEDFEFSREQKIKFSEKFKQCRCPSMIGYKICRCEPDVTHQCNCTSNRKHEKKIKPQC